MTVRARRLRTTVRAVFWTLTTLAALTLLVLASSACTAGVGVALCTP